MRLLMHHTEDEDPAPAAVPAHTVHLAYRAREQAAEATGERRGGEEERVALLGLRPLVPHRDEVEARGEDAALDDTQEEAGRDDPAEVLGEALEEGDEAEEEHA